MTAPVWVTPPGELGTIVEGEFYQVQLDATNANSYSHLSGVLPNGIRITTNGVVEGNPRNYDYIQGVPSEVSQNVTSKFVVRATATDGTVADRVFELTVTGQDAPTIDATPASDLGAYFDGDQVDVQLSATDPDPNDTLVWSLLSGDLPTGLSVTSTGRIFGYIEPIASTSGTAGYDATAYDTNPFDFSTRSISRRYEFTIAVTDGKDIDTKSYSLFAASRDLMSTDSTILTADNDRTSVTTTTLERLPDASQHIKHSPVLLTESTGLGRIDHSNNFNFQFVGKDFDGDNLEYIVSSGTLPTGLSLNADTGWLTGTLPDQAATEKNFSFGIQVRKADDTAFISAETTFAVTVVGNVSSTVTWPDAAMTIKTGEISELDVVATISDGRPVQYELKSGVQAITAGNFVVGETYTIKTAGTTDFIAIGSADNKVGTIFTATGTGSGSGTASLGSNKLPQGLRLNEDGLIVGRVSFEQLMFDTGTTTFDFDNIDINETTFEHTYSFVARVFSTDLQVDTYKKFTITVTADSNKPYENVFARALPVRAQRDIYADLIQNTDDIPAEDIYRASDFSFGIQNDLRFLLQGGLQPVPDTDYIEAMSKNFYNNTLRFGGFKTARALNSDGTVKYEVVYVDIIDNMQGTNPSTGLSDTPALRQDLRSDPKTWTNPLNVDQSWPDVSHAHYLVSQANNYYAYPNSIANMRKRLIADIGHQLLERKVLPDWMVDKQEDGSSLGWILAVPIVYCKPGTAKKIKYRLEQRTTIDLKSISFEIDRLLLDNNLSKFFNKTTGKFTVTSETTFDVASTVTTFEGDGTRFFASIDVYAAEDEGDKFLKFPQVNVFR